MLNKMFGTEINCVKVSKYGVFSGPWSEIRRKAGKYGPEKIPYSDTFHVVIKKSRKIGQEQTSLMSVFP